MAESSKADHVYMNCASELAKLSKCVSFHVCALLVKNSRIIGFGLNGSPSGYTNCCDQFPNYNPTTDRSKHREWSGRWEVHAEVGALLWAAKNGICVSDATMYVTLQPCENCLKHVITAGIKRIIYKDPYDKCGWDAETRDMLATTRVSVEWLPFLA